MQHQIFSVIGEDVTVKLCCLKAVLSDACENATRYVTMLSYSQTLPNGTNCGIKHHCDERAILKENLK